MRASPAPFRITPEQYLAAERQAAHKSEYFDGDVYARAGASPNHLTIAANFIMEAGPALKKRSCRIYASDLKVWLPAARTFVYPDLVVACTKPRFRDETGDVLENPAAIVEILSPSTERYDRTMKFDGYASIPGFLQYVLISQDAARVEVFTREQPSGPWLFHSYLGPDAVAELPAIGLAVSLAAI